MIKSLRKRHRQAWLLLSVLLPAGIIMAWLVIPNPSPVKLLQTHQQEFLPVTKSTRDKINYQVTLRTNSGKTKWQLEWVNKRVLAVPSAVIYKASSNPSSTFTPANAELVGRIEATGRYTFTLPDSSGYQPLKLVLFDFIHEQIIDTINLQP